MEMEMEMEMEMKMEIKTLSYSSVAMPENILTTLLAASKGKMPCPSLVCRRLFSYVPQMTYLP
jgi:hypothetical protein